MARRLEGSNWSSPGGKVVGKDPLPKGRWEYPKQKVGRDFVQTETASVHYGLAATRKQTRA